MAPRQRVRNQESAAPESAPAEDNVSSPRSDVRHSGLSWVQSMCQYLSTSRATITRSAYQSSPQKVSEYLSAQTGNLSNAFAARRERFQILQAKSQEWWKSSEWHYSMETPVDLSFLPPWRYVWDELKHALFMGMLSWAMLWYYPYLFAGLLAVLLNVCYYISRIYLSDLPRITFNPANPKTASILSKCPCIYRKFFPTIWAFGAKVQTLLFAIWPFPLWVLRGRVEYTREIVPLQDGGSVALDWFVPPALRHEVQSAMGTVIYEPGSISDVSSPIVVVLSGVVGEVSNLYVKRLVMYIHKAHPGWRIVVKSWRGIGVKLTSPRPETWGPQAVSDLQQCVLAISSRYPDAPLLGVGFSFGGLVLANHMGVHADEGGFTAGVNISGTFELTEVAKHVEGTIYDWLNTTHLLSHLQADLPWVAWAVGSDNKLHDLSGQAGIRKYHEQVTNHFMKKDGQLPDTDGNPVDMGHLLNVLTEAGLDAAPKVTAPLLCFMADDDPLTPLGSYERMLQACKRSPSTVLVQTKRGGHCGWFHGLGGKSWLDKQVVDFLSATLETNRTDNSACLTRAIETSLALEPGWLQGLSQVDEITLSMLLHATNQKLLCREAADSSEVLDEAPAAAQVLDKLT